MAALYRIDRRWRAVLTTFEGVIGVNDVLRYAQLLIKDSDFVPHFNQLTDLRRVTELIVGPDAARTVALFDPFSASARWSFVVANELQYGLLRVFIGQAGFDHDYDLFFDPREAHTWLGLEAAVRPAHVAA